MRETYENIIKEVEKDISELEKDLNNPDPAIRASRARSISYAQGVIQDCKETLRKYH